MTNIARLSQTKVRRRCSAIPQRRFIAREEGDLRTDHPEARCLGMNWRLRQRRRTAEMQTIASGTSNS